MATTAEDDCFLKSPQIGFGRWQCVIEQRHFLFEECFGLVAFRRKRVESVGEAVVKDGQLRDALGGNA